MNEQKPLLYEFGEYRLDVAKRQLRRNEETVALGPKAFDVLAILVRGHGHVVAKDELMTLVWGDTAVEENSLNVNISALRRILGEKPREHRFIATVPGIGYQFVADVAEIPNRPSPTATKESEEIPERPENRAKSTNRLIVIGAGLLLLVVLAALCFYLFSLNRGEWTDSTAIKRTIQITSSSGLDFYPSISQDGNIVAFSSDRSGSFEIYTRQLVSGARDLQITSDEGQNFQPVFSPDGSMIAYHSKKRGGIWVIPSTGGTARQLTESGSHPAWSPDGSQIAFQTDPLSDLGFSSVNSMPPSTIWIAPSKGGESKQLTFPGKPAGGHGSPSWSPDGKRLLFNSNDLVLTDLWSVSVQGDDFKKLYSDIVDAVFAPNGKSVLMSNGRSLLKLAISGSGDPMGEPVKLFDISGPRIRHIAIAAKSKRIVYTAISTVSNIWSLPLNPASESVSGPPTALTKSNNRTVTPAFSPDGKRIAYQPSTVGFGGSIWVMNSDGSNQIQTTPASSGFPWWLDNKRMVFRSDRGDNVSSLWMTDVDGGKENKLFDFEGDVSFIRVSPDGKKMAFNSKRDGALNVWTVNIDGKELRQMTFGKELMGFPAWSRDGKWIAFQLKHDEDTNVAVMPAEGGPPVQITFDKGQNWLYDWSPDNDKIVFAGQRDGLWNIYWVSRSTGEEKRLTNFDKFNSYVRYPAWSPTNDKIVFEYAETTGNVWMMELK